MTDYSPPEWAGRWAERVDCYERESEQARQRLADASIEQIKGVLRDRQEPLAARAHALGMFLESGDPELPGIVLDLYDDAERDLSAMAIQHSAPFSDPRIAERLRGMLDDARDWAWPAAACALARKQDETILPRLTEWLQRGDEPHRNVAIECLLQLKAHHHLVEAWEQGGRDEDDRVALAIALTRSEDTRGVPLLEAVARRADGNGSVTAATWLSVRDPALGLRLMLGILDRGTLRAKQAMVNQIWNFNRSPHAFTADGIHEARCWVEQKLQAGSALFP